MGEVLWGCVWLVGLRLWFGGLRGGGGGRGGWLFEGWEGD